MVPFVDLLRSYRTIDGTRGPGAAQGSSPWWLPLSWERPREFFAALWTQAESALGGPAKSQPEVGIDFYADLVTRHLHRASKSAAVRWHEPAEGWQSLTLWQLDEQARALASILVGKGLQPGEHLALVLPSGASMVVGIMAALSVGSVAIPVLPLGRTYVQRLLADSKAKQVVTCSPYTALHGLLDYQPLVLSKALLAQAGAGPPSVTYAPDAPALLVRSPLRAPDSLLAVTAADSYCSALRDGLLLFGLRPGERLATPATPQYAPATYLAALLCGAGLTELSAEAVRMDASPLYGASLRAVVLTQALRAEGITTPVITQSAKLSLPKETNVPTQTKPENILISITKDGDIYWNTQLIPDTDALFEKLKVEAVKTPQPEVHIRGDENARYESIGKVVYTCQRASILKVGFITEPPPRS